MDTRTQRYFDQHAAGDCPVLFYREAEVRELGRQAGLTSVEIVPIQSSGTGFMLIGSV